MEEQYTISFAKQFVEVSMHWRGVSICHVWMYLSSEIRFVKTITI